MNDPGVVKLWDGLGAGPQPANSHQMMKALIAKYLHIMHNQFRKEAKDRFGLEKTLAHRAKNKGQSDKAKVLSFTQIISPTNTVESHTYLHNIVKEKGDGFLATFTKDQLVKLGSGYNVACPKRLAKPALIALVSKAILTSASLVNPNFTVPQAKKRPSKSQHTPVAKTARIEPLEEDSQWPCPVCHLPYTDTLRSIGCDGCQGWLHEHCSGITDPQEWERFTASGSNEQWFYPPCTDVSAIIKYARGCTGTLTFNSLK